MPRLLREAVGLGQQQPVLVDHRLAVPGQVGGGLARAGRGVEVGGQAARGRRAAQQVPVLGAADGDRAAGQVGQHRRPGQRRLRARRDRHPHVLADLHVQHEAGQVGRGEQQVGAERDLDAAIGCPRARRPDPDGSADVVAGCGLAALVELPVGGQVRLRGDAEDPSAVHDHRGVVDPVPVAQRGAHHEHRQQLGRRRDQLEQGPLDALQQGVLHEQVLDRVAGQRQLREHRQPDAVGVALPGGGQHRVGVGRRDADRGRDRAGGDPEEAVPVGRTEVHRVIVPFPAARPGVSQGASRPSPGSGPGGR